LDAPGAGVAEWELAPLRDDNTTGEVMAKGGRKRRARRKNKANHGKRPNA